MGQASEPRGDAPIRFGTSGWRGILGEDFTLSAAAPRARRRGPLAGQRKAPRREVIVAHDTRFLGERMAALAVAVLHAHGQRPAARAGRRADARRRARDPAPPRARRPRLHGEPQPAGVPRTQAAGCLGRLARTRADPTRSKRCSRAPGADAGAPAPRACAALDLVAPYLEGSAGRGRARADRTRAAARGLRRDARRRGARAHERARAPRRARHAAARRAGSPLRRRGARSGAGAAARALAQRCARARGLRLGLATDGDADRFAAVDARWSRAVGDAGDRAARRSPGAQRADPARRRALDRDGLARRAGRRGLWPRGDAPPDRLPLSLAGAHVGRGRCGRRRERRLRAGKLRRRQGRDPLRLSARGARGDASRAAARAARASSSAATAAPTAVAPRSPLQPARARGARAPARGAALACRRARGCARRSPPTACAWSSTTASCCCAPRAPSRCCGSTPKRARRASSRVGSPRARVCCAADARRLRLAFARALVNFAAEQGFSRQLPMEPPRVLLAVSGGIAAYKVPELVRALRRSGHARALHPDARGARSS